MSLEDFRQIAENIKVSGDLFVALTLDRKYIHEV